MQRIAVEMSEEEYAELLKLKEGKTWRELLLPPLGIETSRRYGGPHRKLNPEEA